MQFRLYRDKILFGYKNMTTFLEAGTYDVARVFDNRRVLVITNQSRPRQLTLLRFSDGELFTNQQGAMDELPASVRRLRSQV